MKTKEEILDKKFKEHGIRKGWIDESKQAVLDAMDEYADEKLRLYQVSGRFSSNDVDLSYCCGVFNVVGIDGLSDELKRLKEINKKPHEIFNFKKRP